VPTLAETLSAGTYTSFVLVPHVTFTVPAGFHVGAELMNLLSLTNGTSANAPEIAIIRVDSAAIFDQILKIPNLVFGKPTTENVAGITGRAVDLDVPAAYFGTADIVQIPDGEGFFGFIAGTKAHLIEVTAAGRPMLVLYDAQVAAYPGLAKAAKTVLASIKFIAP
jgi:hypothetical protein